jgi:hypothetical protein
MVREVKKKDTATPDDYAGRCETWLNTSCKKGAYDRIILNRNLRRVIKSFVTVLRIN